MLEAGKLEIKLDRTSVSDLVFDCLSMFIDQCRKRA